VSAACEPRRIIACFGRSTRSRQLYFTMLSRLTPYSLARLHYSKDIIATATADGDNIALLVLDYATYKRLAGGLPDIVGYVLGVSDEAAEREEMRREGLVVASFGDFRDEVIRLLDL
jgi:hypothetical protein